MRKDDAEKVWRASALLGMKEHPGWKIVEAEIKERMEAWMRKIKREAHKGTPTLKTIIQNGAPHEEFEDLLEWIDEEIAAAE